MLSRLAPLFKTMLRKAESADTRLAIRRDEKEDGGGKKEFADSPDQESDLWTDSTVVSIDALHAFLLTFIKSDGTRDSGPPHAVAAHPDGAPPETALTPRAAAAVKAYGAAAHAGGHEHAPPPREIAETADTENADESLSLEELQTVRQLIQDLDFLTRMDVATLTIEKAGTFLESLAAAVAAQKNRL